MFLFALPAGALADIVDERLSDRLEDRHYNCSHDKRGVAGNLINPSILLLFSFLSSARGGIHC